MPAARSLRHANPGGSGHQRQQRALAEAVPDKFQAAAWACFERQGCQGDAAGSTSAGQEQRWPHEGALRTPAHPLAHL